MFFLLRDNLKREIRSAVSLTSNNDFFGILKSLFLNLNLNLLRKNFCEIYIFIDLLDSYWLATIILSYFL